jgi:hypothetical protein
MVLAAVCTGLSIAYRPAVCIFLAKQVKKDDIVSLQLLSPGDLVNACQLMERNNLPVRYVF